MILLSQEYSRDTTLILPGSDFMLKIKFKYADALSNWQWREQCCIVSSIEECKRIYNLGIDCEYEILSVEEVDKSKHS